MRGTSALKKSGFGFDSGDNMTSEKFHHQAPGHVFRLAHTRRTRGESLLDLAYRLFVCLSCVLSFYSSTSKQVSRFGSKSGP